MFLIGLIVGMIAGVIIGVILMALLASSANDNYDEVMNTSDSSQIENKTKQID